MSDVKVTGMTDQEERTFWDWWTGKKQETFTVEQINKLLDMVKKFNAGAIDEYLSNHVDAVFAEWLQENCKK